MTESGISMLKMFEGLRLKPYADVAGKATIGYGHLILPGESFDGPITEEQAEELLLSDITKHERGLLSLVNVHLDPWEFDALVSFVFNVGGGAFKRSTMLRMLVDGALSNEVADQFPRWNKAGGKVLAGLTRRRCAEAACFLGAGPGLISAIYGG